MNLPLEAYSVFAAHFFGSPTLHPLLAFDYLLNMMSVVLDILKQVPEAQFQQLLFGSAKSKLMECLSRMVVFGHMIGLPEYQDELLFDAVNPRYASFDAGWYSTLAQVIESTREYQDLIHHWKLSYEQIARLNSYLKANWLLIECLNVAEIEGREAIENRILLPPNIS